MMLLSLISEILIYFLVQFSCKRLEPESKGTARSIKDVEDLF